MSFLQALFQSGPDIDHALAQRVSRWRALPEPSPHMRIEDARFVVIDVKTTGLDVQRSDWLGYFNIPAPARHGASGDALVTAELLLIALSKARRNGIREVKALAKLAGDQACLEGLMKH
jgi:DNA polymerase III epsilon subunit-like protein